ncbi:hypothetical protein Tco_1365517 [Tanacetum coccineum]
MKMANLSEDIQCAGSNTRPPMLDRTDFASWQQHIHKDRYNADIQGTNILLQGLPKDIYTLINHYTDAKDIWDNVKMLLEGSELTKEDRESQLTPLSTHLQPHFADNTQLDSGLSPTENLIENLTNTLALLTQSYKTYLPQTNNQLRTSSNARNQATVQDDRVVVQNVQGRQNKGQGNNARGTGAAGYEGAQNRVGNGTGAAGYGGAQNRVWNANPGQARHIKCYNYNGGQDNAVDEDVDEQPVQDLTLIVDNVFQADDCDAFDSDVDEAPTTQTMFMANLSSADPVYDEASPLYDSDILSEVPYHDNYQDDACEHHEVHEMHDDVQPNYVVDSHADYTSDSNMILYDQYVKDNAMPDVQSNESSVPNDAYMMILNDIYEPSA